MVNRCVVFGCSNTTKEEGVSLHKFPSDPIRRTIWKKSVQRTRAKWPGPSAHSAICTAHFEPSSYEDHSLYLQFGMKRKCALKPDALPTIFPGKKTILTPTLEKPTRGAFQKRERIRILNEALGQSEKHISIDKQDETTKLPVPTLDKHEPIVTTNNLLLLSGSQNEQTTSRAVHLVVDDNVVPLMTSPLPNVKVLYLIKLNRQDPNSESASPRQTAEKQQVIFSGQTGLTCRQSDSVEQLPVVHVKQESLQDSENDKKSHQPVVEGNQQTPQGCLTDPGLVSNQGGINSDLIEELSLVHVKQESLQDLMNSNGNQQPVPQEKQQILQEGQIDPGLVSNQGKIKMGSGEELLEVTVKQEPSLDSKNEEGGQQPILQTELGHKSHMDRGQGWIKSELLEQTPDADTRHRGNLIFFTNTGDEVQMDVCVEGKDIDKDDAKVYVKQELLEEEHEKISDSGIGHRYDDMVDYFKEVDQFSQGVENAETSEDEDEDWEMKDDSSDEDYVPEVQVRTSKLQKRRGAVLRTRRVNQKVSIDCDNEDGEENTDEISEENRDLTSDTNDELSSSSEDSDQEERKKRRAPQKKAKKRSYNVRQEVKFSRYPATYECKTCQERCPEVESMRVHYTEIHLNANKKYKSAGNGPSVALEGDISEIATKLIQCPQCKEYVKNLAKHLKSHRVNRFVCEVCARQFSYASTLYLHQETHIPRRDRKHKCPECNKMYVSKRYLFDHIKDKHRKNALERYICEQCGRQFGVHRRLQRHKLIHLEEKPFKCKECGRGFNQKSNMSLHMRLHTGARPYQCQICGEVFNHNISLKHHKKKKHGIDWWKQNQKETRK